MIELPPFPGPLLRREDFDLLLRVGKLEPREPWSSLQQLASYWLTVQSETTTRRQYLRTARTTRQVTDNLKEILTNPSDFGRAMFLLDLVSEDGLMIHDVADIIAAMNDAARKLEATQKFRGRSTIKWIENPLALLLLEFYAIGGKRSLPSNEAPLNLIFNNPQHAFAKRFIEIVSKRAQQLDVAQRGPFWTMELVDHLRSIAVNDTALVKLLRRARARSGKMSRTWLYSKGIMFENGRTVYREV